MVDYGKLFDGSFGESKGETHEGELIVLNDADRFKLMMLIAEALEAPMDGEQLGEIATIVLNEEELAYLTTRVSARMMGKIKRILVEENCDE